MRAGTLPERTGEPLSEGHWDTQCPFCSVQCKLRIERRTEAGKTTYAVQPLPNAASEGRLCVKGMNAYQHALGRERLTRPLARVNGELVEIGWEEAFARIRAAFESVQQAYGRDAVGVYGGGSLTNEAAYLLGKFARVALRTRHIDYNGRFCMSAAASAGSRAFGIDRGLTMPLSDIPLAGCIILAGTNIAECQPTLMPYFAKAKENGSFLIVIDPRRTATAELADLHLAVRPGTDAALANGLLKAVVEAGYADEAFAAGRTTGYAELKAHLAELDLAEIAERTGVPEAQIRRAAEAFGAARTGMVFTARGVEQQTDGYLAVRNFLNLLLATGKIGREGCGYGAITGQGNGQGGREHGQKADQLPGYRSIENEADRAHIAKLWGIEAGELPRKGVSAYEMMEKAHSGELRALLVMSSNPIVSNPNADFVEAGLRKLDFLVVADMYLSETARLADLVLPATSYLENGGTMTNLEGRVLLREAATAPPGEARHDWAILGGIAAVLGRAEGFAYDSPEAIFEELRLASRGGLADYYGITYERLRREGGVYWPCPDPNKPGEARLFGESFAHPGGRAELIPVPNHEPPERPDERYPLTLTTGRVLSHYLTGVQTRRSPALAAREIESFAEMHPDTARSCGIGDGELLRLESRRGSVVVRCRWSSAIRMDTVFMPMHWGGVQNVNRLTNPELDPTCRMPGFKACAVSAAPLLAGG